MTKYLRKYIDNFSNYNRERAFYAILTTLLVFAGSFTICAQKRSQSYENYIKRYKKIAVEQQKKHGIPASITLAQGLLESGAGQSRLANEANNHFGIKCGSEWNGKTIKHKAERGNECFRKYKKVEDSYEDHSKFLKRKRYASLFKLKITDYKNWAKGLRKCGYATDPKYPDKLISIIERYELHRFDSDKGKKDEESVSGEDMFFSEGDVMVHAVHKLGKLRFVRAKSGDTYESIAKEFNIKKKKLLSFNDVKKEQALDLGAIIYLQEKNKKYQGKSKTYVVQEGETLYSISQKLGIRLNNLRKMNKKKENDIIKPGETLKIK